jgi:Domain of unknown function (DUF4157)
MSRSAERVPRSRPARTARGGRPAAEGTPLPQPIRDAMEARFATNFADVTVFADDAGAARPSRAATHGTDIAFAPGQFQPQTRAGEALLAHELAHVVQQRDSSGTGSPDVALERQAEDVATAVAEGRALPALSRGAGRMVQREERKGPLSVVPDIGKTDETRLWFDPADKVRKPVWTPESGYVKNPSARELTSLLRNGRIAEGFENGQFMYVVDNEGKTYLGKRLAEPGTGAGRATGMPHPTLIGGRDPVVVAAGEVEIRAGRIFKIDNQSGHFQPGRATMRTSAKAFLKLPTTAFHKDFGMESVHYDEAKVRTVKPFRSVQTLKLGYRDLKSALRALKPQAIRGRMRSPAFRQRMGGAARGIAGVLVMIGLQLGLQKLQQVLDERFIRKQIEELAPKVEDALAAKGDELDRLLEEDPDADIYVNVQFDIGMASTRTMSPGGGDYGEPIMETVDIPPVVWLAAVGYSRQAWDPTPVVTTERSCGATSEKTRITASDKFSPKDLFEPGAQDVEAPRPAEGKP